MFHPRPQLRRDSFFSLDGEWEISVNGGDFQRITVPYPPEAPASGVSFKAQAQTRLTYRRDFSLPESFWQKGRVLLHFGAVDQTADVMLNARGRPLGSDYRQKSRPYFLRQSAVGTPLLSQPK